MALNVEAAGKVYDADSVEITSEKTVAYAKAYNETNDKLLAGEMAPPLFGVVYAWASMGKPMFDQDTGITPMDMMRLLHGEEDMYYIKPVKPGDTITTTPFIEEVVSRPNGETIVIGLQSKNQDDEEVQVAYATIFFRKKGSAAFSAPKAELDKGELVLEKQQTIDDDQTHRYADASGDHNPIHVDENAAKMAKLPGIIVHGLCTMAFTSSVFINELCGGDPTKLKRLKVRFSKPVLPGQTITTKIYKVGKNSLGYTEYAYETFNPDGDAVIRNGVAWVQG